jgi:mannose-6-phosphate isomerase-like protein (cupin superfamily)
MKPYVLRPDQGEAIWMFDSLDTIKADADQTEGGFTVVEFVDFEGSSVPTHINDRWDRGFFIVEGEYMFAIGDESVLASPGTWIFIPRATPHAWRCDSQHGRLLSVTAPAGLEDFYRAAGEAISDRTKLPERTEPDDEALPELAAQYGVTVIGPPPSA